MNKRVQRPTRKRLGEDLFVVIWALCRASGTHSKFSPGAFVQYKLTDGGLHWCLKPSYTVKPTPHFIATITALFQKQQKIVSIDDMMRHAQKALTFYSISEGTFKSGHLINKTDAFSDQIMIEIDKGANTTTIGTPSKMKVYARTSRIDFNHNGGKGFIYWQAEDERGTQYYIVKLMADDGTLQIKIVTTDQQNMNIHNVCELG